MHVGICNPIELKKCNPIQNRIGDGNIGGYNIKPEFIHFMLHINILKLTYIDEPIRQYLTYSKMICTFSNVTNVVI